MFSRDDTHVAYIEEPFIADVARSIVAASIHLPDCQQYMPKIPLGITNPVGSSNPSICLRPHHETRKCSPGYHAFPPSTPRSPPALANDASTSPTFAPATLHHRMAESHAETVPRPSPLDQRAVALPRPHSARIMRSQFERKEMEPVLYRMEVVSSRACGVQARGNGAIPLKFRVFFPFQE